MFNKYENEQGHTILANEKVYSIFYKHKGYKPVGTPAEPTRKEYMDLLDNLGIEYRKNDKLETLKELYESALEG